MSKRKNLKTYLKVYCQNLSDSEDYRLTSFYKKLEEEPRLEGPLFLYSTLYYPKEEYVLDSLSNELKDNYKKTLDSINSSSNLMELKNKLPYEESKALDSFLSYCEENSADNSLKKTYQKKIKEKLGKNISNYKVCKDNNINPGNFHAFINGSLEKISIEKCRKIYKYLEENE